MGIIMNFLNKFLKNTAAITTCTLLVCCTLYTLTKIKNGENIAEATMPLYIFWQPLIMGVLTGFASSVIFSSGDEMSKHQYTIRTILNYICINAVVLFFGYQFGWYELSFAGVFLMIIIIAAVYAAVEFITYTADKKIADKINEKLKSRY